MKTNSLIFSLVSLSLSLTALSARAANLREENEPVQLPAYIVKAERQSAAQQMIDHSLQQLRAIAAKPVVVECTAPLLCASKSAGEQTEKKTSTVVVAGL